MNPKSYPEKDRQHGKMNMKKSDSVAKTAAALFADLFWEQYLYSKRSESDSPKCEQMHIDDKSEL